MSQHVASETLTFELQVLGSPQLLHGGAPVRFRTKKHLAVLLYLHFEGRARPVARDHLVGLLWPDVSPDKGRHSLSQGLLAIRSLLGTAALTGREEDVQLLADLPSDVSLIRDGRVAVAQLAEPLRGLDDCAGAEFAHWVDGARVRLKGQARDALRAAVQAARAGGNLVATHALAVALYAVDPLCIDAVYALAERALLDGDTVAAVRLLNDQVRRAQAELGVNPNPEITRLLRRLERGERPAFLAPSARMGEPVALGHPFVAREAELGQLEAAWNRAAGGARYRTCRVSGAPGIGKTSLLRRFATSLGARAWPVFFVACQEVGQGIPYAGVAELITTLGRDPLAGGTEPLWLAEASRVCPGLRATYPGIPPAPDAPTDSIRLRVAEAVVRMVETVAEHGPLLLAFDDLQFLDPASRDVLFLITRRLERVAALIVAGARGGEGEASADEGAGGLVWEETIHLGPLDRSQALTLVHDLAADAPDLSAPIQETIVRLAQGNPYHIELLLADWRAHHVASLVAAESTDDTVATSWTPPEDVRAAFARQYGGLSADAQHVLQILAVAGRALAPPDLARILGLPGAAVARASLELLDRGVGRAEEGRLSFKNELHRAYVYHTMGEDRRKYHHAELARRLADAQVGEHLETLLEQVHHYLGAGMQSQAMETALQAAEIALARDAPREAERVLTRILQACAVPHDSRLRLALARALVAVGHYQRGLDALSEWRPDRATPGELALAAFVRAEARQRGRLGGDVAIIGAAREAVALAEQAGATALLVRANYVRFEATLDAADLDGRAQAEALAARIAASDANAESVALANLTLGFAALQRGEQIRGVERLNAAAPVLESLSLFVELRRVLNTLGICLKGLGRFDEATRAFRDGVAIAERCGQLGAIAHSRVCCANHYHDLAFFAAAATEYRALVTALEALASARASAEAYSSIAQFALVVGNIPDAEVAADRCVEGAQRSGLWRHQVTALLTRAQLCLAKNQPDAAWPLLEEAARSAGDRSALLPERGLYERLQRQWCWATRGYETMRSLARPLSPLLSSSMADALEVRLFDEAAALVAEGRAGGAPVLEEAAAAGLLGPLARLSAVGVHHPALPQRLPGESPAELVARAYAHPERAVVPRSLDLPPR